MDVTAAAVGNGWRWLVLVFVLVPVVQRRVTWEVRLLAIVGRLRAANATPSGVLGHTTPSLAKGGPNSSNSTNIRMAEGMGILASERPGLGWPMGRRIGAYGRLGKGSRGAMKRRRPRRQATREAQH
ncbi:uncharacterized protein ColSpa_01322 [Colletotrichum spaethianum]|uniref:Uncharacterized protein n=1 Tax=Colletotrichum spaethianum TaxID=700344 RepID=A0AA37L368_9PEZI|nr:uncharacterized protein ColSpa_01322 [Colletotrichum spaethianum]GKT41141.1 hypothetical protein ColSpa_01322 [Colletotrichum spaethianum]